MIKDRTDYRYHIIRYLHMCNKNIHTIYTFFLIKNFENLQYYKKYCGVHHRYINGILDQNHLQLIQVRNHVFKYLCIMHIYIYRRIFCNLHQDENNRSHIRKAQTLRQHYILQSYRGATQRKKSISVCIQIILCVRKRKQV